MRAHLDVEFKALFQKQFWKAAAHKKSQAIFAKSMRHSGITVYARRGTAIAN
jgi:hypothetical protein